MKVLTPTPVNPSSLRKPRPSVCSVILGRNVWQRVGGGEATTVPRPVSYSPSSRRRPGSRVLHESLDSGLRRNDEGFAT